MTDLNRLLPEFWCVLHRQILRTSNPDELCALLYRQIVSALPDEIRAVIERCGFHFHGFLDSRNRLQLMVVLIFESETLCQHCLDVFCRSTYAVSGIRFFRIDGAGLSCAIERTANGQWIRTLPSYQTGV